MTSATMLIKMPIIPSTDSRIHAIHSFEAATSPAPREDTAAGLHMGPHSSESRDGEFVTLVPDNRLPQGDYAVLDRRRL